MQAYLVGEWTLNVSCVKYLTAILGYEEKKIGESSSSSLPTHLEIQDGFPMHERP